jgi:glutamate-1-semialdehyde 2,1-aminomutase
MHTRTPQRSARGSPRECAPASPARASRGSSNELGPRAGYTFRRNPVRDAAEARACRDDLLARLIRIWLANRGVWEAIVGAGPVVPVPANDDDVDAYVSAWNELLDRLTA